MLLLQYVMLGTVVFISKLCQVIVQKVSFYMFLSQEEKVPRFVFCFLTVFTNSSQDKKK